jgi:hypothetical protein
MQNIAGNLVGTSPLYQFITNATNPHLKPVLHLEEKQCGGCACACACACPDVLVPVPAWSLIKSRAICIMPFYDKPMFSKILKPPPPASPPKSTLPKPGFMPMRVTIPRKNDSSLTS